MVDTHLVLSLARLVTAALAGLIGILAIRAYARTHRSNVLALGIGAALLSIGYLAEGVLVELAGWSIADATVLESLMTLVAACILVVSVYLRDVQAARPGRPAWEGSP